MMARSLLDRLLDDNPGRGEDANRRGLQRDLEKLLNTRRPYPAWASKVEQSVAAYGLPDITTEDFGSDGARDRVSYLIERCLMLHEPRLSDVQVTFDPDTSATTGVRFTIYATLRDGGNAVELGARLTPVDRMIAIEGVQ